MHISHLFYFRPFLSASTYRISKIPHATDYIDLAAADPTIAYALVIREEDSLRLEDEDEGTAANPSLSDILPKSSNSNE